MFYKRLLGSSAHVFVVVVLTCASVASSTAHAAIRAAKPPPWPMLVTPSMGPTSAASVPAWVRNGVGSAHTAARTLIYTNQYKKNKYQK
eukprot:1195601-Prorocentrum_minimum.AAC.5